EYNARSSSSAFQAVTNSGPVPTSWTLHNATAALCVMDDFSGRSVELNASGNVTPGNTCLAERSLGAAPYTVIAQMVCEMVPQSSSGTLCGIALYDGTKLYDFEIGLATTQQLTLATRQLATITTVGTPANA